MQTIDDFKSTIPKPGRVEWLGISSQRLSKIESVGRIDVELENGIVGDHHATGGNSKRQVTLIQEEHIPVIQALCLADNVTPELLRRNIVVSGISLLALKDRRFQIGDVILEGTGPCVPCSRMEENLGPGGYNAMRGHGGINTVVIQAGSIRVGDEVSTLPDDKITN